MFFGFLLGMALWVFDPFQDTQKGMLWGAGKGPSIGAVVGGMLDRAQTKADTGPKKPGAPSPSSDTSSASGRVNFCQPYIPPTMQWTIPSPPVAVLAATDPADPARSAPRPGGYEAQPADLALVRSDCQGFVTIRVAELLGKLGGKEAEKLPLVAELQRQLGLSLSTVERFTCVVPAGEVGVVMILQSTKPLPRKAILAACVPEAVMMKHQGMVLHVSKRDGRAVFFTGGDQMLIGGDKEVVKQFLNSPPAKAYVAQSILQGWPQAGKHDVVAWGRATLLVAWDRATLLATLVAKWPQLGVVQSGRITIDVGKQLTTEWRLDCTDEAAARRLEQTLRDPLNALRRQLLLVTAMKDVKDVFPDPAPEASAMLPSVTVLSQVEKGLQHAVIRPEKSSVNVSVSMPIEVRTLRAEVERLTRTAKTEGGVGLPFPLLGQEETRVEGMTLPSGYYLQHPPQYVPPTPPFPSGIVPVAAATPAEPVRPGAGTKKLTVANVRKETALLFEMGEDGKLTFLQKVQPGEAADVRTTTGKRCVAVFPDKPSGETFDPSEASSIWLLR